VTGCVSKPSFARPILRYSLSYRDLEEVMAERGLSLDHSTIWRWVQRYAPILNQRMRARVAAQERFVASG
jgi:IS6 family transposase